MRRSTTHLGVTYAILTAVCVVAVSCDQQPVAPTALLSPTTPATMVVYDPGIDPSNTTITADITQQVQTTVYSAQPFVDPQSGQTVTSLVLAPHPGSFHMELGYDYYNRVRTNQYLPDTAYDRQATLAGDTKIVRIANQSYTEYDATGNVLPVTLPTTSVTRDPLAPLGAFNYRSILDGVFVDTSVTQPISYRPDRTPFPSGARLTLRRGGAQLEIATEVRDAAPAMPLDAGGASRSLSAGAKKGAGRENGRTHRMTKTYDKREGRYVLHEVRTEIDEVSGGRATTQVSVMTLDNVKWHVNKQKDAEREVLLAQALAAGDAASAPSAAMGTAPPSGPSALIACDPSVDPSCGDSAPPPPTPTPTPTGPPQNIVFQHGIISSAKTWDRMDPWLSGTFVFGTKVKLSLPSLQRIDDQASQLMDSINATGQTSFLVVGHSQGGLIGRRAGQRTRGVISGVVTIGSPHLGTNLARNAKQTVSDLVSERIARVADGCYGPYDDWGCYIADQLINKIVSTVVNYAADQAIPVSADLTLHSSFVDAQLNPAYESFQRAGIQSYANKRWMLMRLMGDNYNYPESTYGGRNWARVTQWVYDGFRSCQIASVFFGDWQTSHECGDIANRMEDVDGLWDRLTADGDDSDGIVQGSSQVYPSTPGASVPQQYTIFGGDSHLGETSSDLTRNMLVRSFSNQFNVSRY